MVKVVDFGIAKCPTEVTLVQRTPAAEGQAGSTLAAEPFTFVGTPAYMAPEQLAGGAADARSDIFSFGVVLYEMITGRKPFDGEGPDALRAAIASSPPRSMGDLRADVPPRLARTVGACLTKDPAARLQTAHDVLAQLQSLAVRPGRMRKAAWLGLGAACAALLAGVPLYLNSGNAEAITSIAVLPFANATGAPDTEYLSDGVAEGIINNLSAAPRLKVIARATVFRFKGQKIEPRIVGRQLAVEAVLTGRVSRRGDSMMIQIDLVNVADGSQLWGEHFRRNVADLQTLPGDMAREIAENLRLNLAGEQRQRLTKRYTDNAEAYQLYLKAVYVSADTAPYRSPDDYLKRIDYLQQAIARDPGFARAYVQLAISYRALAEMRVWPANKAFDKQREAARTAVELDDGLGEAHVEVALALWWRDWDWAGAEREFRRAIALNTGSAHVHYARFLALTGRTHEALTEVRRAIEVDPLSRVTLTNAGFVYWMTRDYDQALDLARRVNPQGIAYILEAKGLYQEAIAEFEKLGDTVGIRGHLAHSYARAGRLAEARRILRELQARASTDGVGAYEIAFIYGALGQKDEAFKWLDVAYRQRDPGLMFLKVDPTMDALRSDPRFHGLQRRVGLPP